MKLTTVNDTCPIYHSLLSVTCLLSHILLFQYCKADDTITVTHKQGGKTDIDLCYHFIGLLVVTAGVVTFAQHGALHVTATYRSLYQCAVIIVTYHHYIALVTSPIQHWSLFCTRDFPHLALWLVCILQGTALVSVGMAFFSYIVSIWYLFSELELLLS